MIYPRPKLNKSKIVNPKIKELGEDGKDENSENNIKGRLKKRIKD
jgi:hypothetical protein